MKNFRIVENKNYILYQDGGNLTIITKENGDRISHFLDNKNLHSIYMEALNYDIENKNNKWYDLDIKNLLIENEKEEKRVREELEKREKEEYQKELKEVKEIHFIDVTKWQDASGNTYHTCMIYYDDLSKDYIPYTYGYGRHWQTTIKEKLKRDIRFNEINFKDRVVRRKRDMV